MKKGYQDAIALGLGALSRLEHEDVCRRTGSKWTGSGYLTPWLNGFRALESGTDIERVLWLHYLVSEGGSAPSGRLIAFHDIRGAGFYEPKFTARALRPIVFTFGGKPETLITAALALGGEKAPGADAAVVIHAFPKLPITYRLWGADDTGGASGQILFDSSAPGWLPAEDLVVAASLASYALVKARA